MEAAITLTIYFDPERIKHRFEITDGLNETLHLIAVDLDLVSDEETGGYVGLDWEYDKATQQQNTGVQPHGH